MPEKMPEDEDIDLFFAAAKAASPLPSTALMDRVLAQAQAVQPRRATPLRARRTGIMAALGAALGGAPGFAGLTASVLAGFWIGFAEPLPVSDLSQLLGVTVTSEDIELLPDFDEIAIEG